MKENYSHCSQELFHSMTWNYPLVNLNDGKIHHFEQGTMENSLNYGHVSSFFNSKLRQITK